MQYKEGGRLIAVEVKGTTSRQFHSFDLTKGEREAAAALGEDYELWLVADLRSKTPLVEVVRNPLKELEKGWFATPMVWRIERLPPQEALC